MSKCPKCGALNNDQALFCNQCGTSLSSQASAPSPAPASGNAPKKSNTKVVMIVLVLLFVGVIVGGIIYVFSSGDSRGVPQEQEVYTEVNDAPEDLVYCSSWDGYLSIRDAPSSKGEKIGKFRCGPQGAIKLSETDKWVEIDYNGVVGYVFKKYVVDYPTKAVTVDIDDKWLMGPWYPEHREYAYLLFNNGSYTVQYEYGTLAYGTYYLEGDEIVFTATMVNDRGYDIGAYERHRVTVSPKRIGPLTKRSFIKEDDRWEHYGELVWTWAEYAELKKQTKDNVGLR